MPTKTCTIEGCTNPHHARGLCPTHLKRVERHGDPQAGVPQRVRNAGKACRAPECELPAKSRGLCGGHYWQESHGQELTPLHRPKPKGAPCEIEGCGRPSLTDGLCRAHYDRRRRGDQDWARPIVSHAPHGEGHINEDGYRVITVNGRPKLEHRHLVEELLGRRLLRAETVHHVNGHRADNRTSGPLRPRGGKLRSGNLELWSTSQPAGQEVPAKVAYAREILALYGELVPAN